MLFWLMEDAIYFLNGKLSTTFDNKFVIEIK